MIQKKRRESNSDMGYYTDGKKEDQVGAYIVASPQIHVNMFHPKQC